MKNTKSSVLVMCLCAGMAASADEPLVSLEASKGRVVEVAHIYFNIASGERVVTLLGDQSGDGQTAPADNGTSGPIWSSMVNNMCADQGYTTEFFFGFDNNSGSSSLATAVTLLDYGDISVDSVVDCVHINWVVGHPDTDQDSDGVGDGVSGLGGRWTYWDTDNGREAQSCMRLPLISFAFLDLPGHTAAPGAFSRYTADVDLVAAFTGIDLSFEIGDSDGDLQGAAFGHSNVDSDSDGVGDGPIATLDRDFDGIPDADLDSDGLFDWSWGVRFFQPGTADQDGDGVIDGDIADSFHSIGVGFGAPDGSAVDNGDGNWTWVIDTTGIDAGTGQEDRFAFYGPNGNQYLGGFWFGGLNCDPDQPDGGYVPAAMFEHQLIGPRGNIICCPPDRNCDGSLDFFDVSLFLTDFNAGGDYNGDGSTDFFDVSLFLTDFSSGCP